MTPINDLFTPTYATQHVSPLAETYRKYRSPRAQSFRVHMENFSCFLLRTTKVLSIIPCSWCSRRRRWYSPNPFTHTAHFNITNKQKATTPNSHMHRKNKTIMALSFNPHTLCSHFVNSELTVRKLWNKPSLAAVNERMYEIK